MFGSIPMQNPSSPDFQHHEHVDDAERGRDRDEEIARQGRTGVIPHECAPQCDRVPSCGAEPTGMYHRTVRGER